MKELDMQRIIEEQQADAERQEPQPKPSSLHPADPKTRVKVVGDAFREALLSPTPIPTARM